MMKNQLNNYRIRSHEYQESIKTSEIKRSNQVLLERLMDISKGKGCAVKQENLAQTLQAPRSLNYILKRREAERIDKENDKIMRRIIRQGPTVQSKKFEQEYKDTTLRFKKMKQKTLAISVEKIIERKRQHLQQVKSSLLPLISQSTKN